MCLTHDGQLRTGTDACVDLDVSGSLTLPALAHLGQLVRGPRFVTAWAQRRARPAPLEGAPGVEWETSPCEREGTLARLGV